MLRYLSIALAAVLLLSQTVRAEVITYRFLDPNSPVFTVEDLGVPVATPPTFSVADLAPTIPSSMSGLSDSAAALARTGSSASVGPRPQVTLSVTEPATIALLGIGFLLLSAFGHRRRERSGRRAGNRRAPLPRIL